MLHRHIHMHKPLINSIFLTPFWQVKGYPSCHTTAAGGAGGQRGTEGCGAVQLHRRQQRNALPEGTAPGRTVTRPTVCPCNCATSLPLQASHERQRQPETLRLQKARKFFWEIVTSQVTLNSFVWAERRGLGLPGDASAFCVNPTHTWPIFCCSERTVTIYLIQTRQLLGYIWTS